MRGRIRRGGWAALSATALAALVACGTVPKTPEATPIPTRTVTPLPAPSPTPTIRAMPVDTTPASSIYDRTPGVLHEEKKPDHPVVAKTMTPRR